MRIVCTMLTLGTKIGQGAHKFCFTIKERSDKVALVSQNSLGGWDYKNQKWHPPHNETASNLQYQFEVLAVERDLLKKLRQAGIPTLGARLNLLKIDKKLQIWALVCPRYDFSERDRFWETETRYKPGHAEALARAARAIRDSKLSVGDPQFLFKGDSEVAIADPLTVDDDVRAHSNWTAVHADNLAAAIRAKTLGVPRYDVQKAA